MKKENENSLTSILYGPTNRGTSVVPVQSFVEENFHPRVLLSLYVFEEKTKVFSLSLSSIGS